MIRRWQAIARPTRFSLPASTVSLSLRQNFSWTLLGNVVFAGSQWGILVLLAKLSSPEAVGQFVLGLAIVNPVIILAGLDLRLVQATDARRDFGFGDYLGLRLLGVAVALAAIAGIAGLGGFQRTTMLVILLIGLARAVEAVSDVFFGLFQQRERMDWVAQSLIVRGLLSLLAVGVTIVLTRSVVWVVIVLVAVSTAVLAAFDLSRGQRILAVDREMRGGTAAAGEGGTAVWELGVNWSRERLLRLTRLTLPMGAVAMLIALNPSLPRYALTRYWSERELGIFAAIAYLMVVGSTIKTALDHSMSPRLAELYAHGTKHQFQRFLMKMLGIGVLVGIAGIAVAALVGEQLLTLLYTPEYAEHRGAFVWLMVAAGLGHLASSLRYGITAAREFRVQLGLYVGSALVMAGASVLLVPTYGVLGGALAAVCALGFEFLGSSALMAHILSRRRGQPPLLEGPGG